MLVLERSVCRSTENHVVKSWHECEKVADIKEVFLNSYCLYFLVFLKRTCQHRTKRATTGSNGRPFCNSRRGNRPTSMVFVLLHVGPLSSFLYRLFVHVSNSTEIFIVHFWNSSKFYSTFSWNIPDHKSQTSSQGGSMIFCWHPCNLKENCAQEMNFFNTSSEARKSKWLNWGLKREQKGPLPDLLETNMHEPRHFRLVSGLSSFLQFLSTLPTNDRHSTNLNCSPSPQRAEHCKKKGSPLSPDFLFQKKMSVIPWISSSKSFFVQDELIIVPPTSPNDPVTHLGGGHFTFSQAVETGGFSLDAHSVSLTTFPSRLRQVTDLVFRPIPHTASHCNCCDVSPEYRIRNKNVFSWN